MTDGEVIALYAANFFAVGEMAHDALAAEMKFRNLGSLSDPSRVAQTSGQSAWLGYVQTG